MSQNETMDTESAGRVAPGPEVPSTELTDAEPRDAELTEESAAAAPEGESTQGAEQEIADEGDIAADYLEELLDIVDLDGDIDIEIRGDRTFISVVAEEGAEDLEVLVGSSGQTLEALQELSRLAVLTASGQRSRLVLDIAGYRDRRQAVLREMADKAIEEAKSQGQAVHLEPMGAYERKIVHDFIAEAGLVSESEGEGKRRHIVVSAE